MGMHDNDHCINCARAVTGPEQKFCPGCGQPTPVHRIDWHFLGHELEHSVLHMDRGILYSLRELMLRPGRLMRDYIDGRRGNHVKPLLLVMVTAAAVVLLSRLFAGGTVMETDAPAGMAQGLEPGAAALVARYVAASKAVAGWIDAHFAAFTLALLPIEAWVLRLVFGRYGRLNYPEWLVITALLTVQVFVVWSVLIPFERWIPSAQVWVGLAGVAYAVYSLLQFFEGRPAWSTIWRALLGYGVFSVLSSVAVAMAIFVLMLVS